MYIYLHRWYIYCTYMYIHVHIYVHCMHTRTQVRTHADEHSVKQLTFPHVFFETLRNPCVYTCVFCFTFFRTRLGERLGDWLSLRVHQPTLWPSHQTPALAPSYSLWPYRQTPEPALQYSGPRKKHSRRCSHTSVAPIASGYSPRPPERHQPKPNETPRLPHHLHPKLFANSAAKWQQLLRYKLYPSAR